MKKILLACLIGAASLATLGSCTKEYVTNYLPGVTYSTNVASDKWVSKGDGIYTVDLDFPELDATYMDYGTVQVAAEFPETAGSYDIFPATINGIHYSVNYAIGSVMIFAENRNSNPEAPVAMKIKVTLTDADNGGI